MREKLIENTIREIYGPRTKNDDISLVVNEILDVDPISEFLTGVLVPKSLNIKNTLIDGTNVNPDSEQIKEVDSDMDDNNDEVTISSDMTSEIDPRLRIKSFGLSFYVNPVNPIFDVCVTWAMYSEKEKDEQGRVLSWQRKPYNFIGSIDLNDTDNLIRIYEEDENHYLGLIIKENDENDRKLVTLTLLNNLKQPENDLFPNVNSCIFQPSIRVNYENEIAFNQDYADELNFIYRNRPVKAIGHMCSAIWDEIDYKDHLSTDVYWPDGSYFSKDDEKFKEFFNPTIRTEFVPLYAMPIYDFDILDDGEDNCLNAELLSELWDNDELRSVFHPLINKYENWISNLEKEKITLDKEFNLSELTENIIEKHKVTLKRMKLSIKLLTENDDVKLAFCFANKAISLQNSWKDNSNTFKWRPFQLAFILMNIESIINTNSEFRDTLDLLWISTGGGKTEAYLGIMAFTLAYRRITSVKNHKSGAGISIFSRYTLRLLTIQQFRRTNSLTTAMELLRVHQENDLIGWRPKKSDISDNMIYGSTRFSIGLWVGGAVTHLHLNEAINGLIGIPEKGNPAQIMKCPVCDHWISIPNEGLFKQESQKHKLHLIIKEDNLKDLKDELLDNVDLIKDIEFSNKNHLENNTTMTISFKDEDISLSEIDKIYEILNGKVLSLNIYRPGYFGTVTRPNGDKYFDYETYCVNPDCELNNHNWFEGIPYREEGAVEYVDGNFDNKLENLPFDYKFRVPISAYTVDEHVYAKCPSIVISTADKIARIAFEARTASLFGNVNYYNKYYGYLRGITKDLLPKDNLKTFSSANIGVEMLDNPDLIIQDELHLIDGPLGSLFGLYEATVSAILSEKGNLPKYIASTATIKNSEMQCKNTFAKQLSQFPPHGLTIDDNFFVKEIEESEDGSGKSPWDENIPSRIFMGIYSPGRGPMTPQVRLWSSLLNTSQENIDDTFIKYYWTLVGYYNSMRELGGGTALYREDIVERLNQLKSERKLNPDTIELSSRIPSTEIPQKLSVIEMDGANDIPKNDVIFTTSMFGTGVDISHLSLMIVNGQPKTTSSYIQATGRIGRKHGGLILMFLKAGRPRDLNHYEMFTSYHHRLNLGVEPVSVSPFSVGSLNKALGANLVAYLRTSSKTSLDWTVKQNGNKINDKIKKDIDGFKTSIKSRLNYILDDVDKVDDILKNLDSQVDSWETVSKMDANLHFYEYIYKGKPKHNVVLGDPAHENSTNIETVYKNVPQSLREIEDTTGFWV